MDSIEQSSRCGQLEILFACVSCISSLLSTLVELSSGKGINEKYVEKINTLFPSITDADYSGNFDFECTYSNGVSNRSFKSCKNPNKPFFDEQKMLEEMSLIESTSQIVTIFSSSTL